MSTTLDEDFKKYIGEWPAAKMHMAPMLSLAHVWNWFGDHGCFIGPGGPFSDGEGYDAGAMTDPARTPFERLFFKAATPDDPRAFIAVRALPGKQFRKRCSDSMGRLSDLRTSLSNKEDGLDVFALYPSLMDDSDREWGPESAFEITEKELRARYAANPSVLVQWV
jgi:hypothetical protein